MAQQKRSTYRKQKSDFPIFDYIDMLMPQNLIARFVEMPRHVRWTIISAAASLFLLWVFLRIVVGSLNYWIETRGPFLNDTYYLPYNLTQRPLPVYPEGVVPDDRFLLLPNVIADHYVLQVPPREEELQAARAAELEAFLTLSGAAEDSLNALRETLSAQLAETAAATDTEETVDESAPAAAVNSEVEPTVDAEVVPTAVPTIDPVLVQITALDGVLTPLIALNETLQDTDSIDPVYGTLPILRGQLHAMEASGITMPLEIAPLQSRLDEMAVVEPTIDYSTSECLMAALFVEDANDETAAELPCPITQRAWYVEQGDYVANDGAEFNIVVAEFPRPVDAAWAIKQLFYRSRFIGSTGNFALDNIIEYNYYFGQIDGVYTLAWSHENWVYSVSNLTITDIDRMMKVFPY